MRRVVAFVATFIVLLCASGCSLFSDEPPTGSAFSCSDPLVDEVAAGNEIAVFINEVALDGQDVTVGLTICPTDATASTDMIVDVEAFNKADEPDRVQYGQTFVTGITIPADGLSVSLTIDIDAPMVGAPVVGAGVFGAPSSVGGPWGELASNWDTATQ